MTERAGTSGLIMNEPLLWEKSKQGRLGISIPESDVAAAPLDAEFAGRGPGLSGPLSEVDVVRHFTRLSQWNFGVDTGMYPLGSCTMKYNPKINEKDRGHAGVRRRPPHASARAVPGGPAADHVRTGAISL